MKKLAATAAVERIRGVAPSRWRAMAASATAGAAVAVVTYRVLRQPA